MFKWGLILVIAVLVSLALGSGSLSSTAAGIVKLVFIVGLVMFVLNLITGRSPRA